MSPFPGVVSGTSRVLPVLPRVHHKGENRSSTTETSEMNRTHLEPGSQDLHRLPNRHLPERRDDSHGDFRHRSRRMWSLVEQDLTSIMESIRIPEQDSAGTCGGTDVTSPTVQSKHQSTHRPDPARVWKGMFRPFDHQRQERRSFRNQETRARGMLPPSSLDRRYHMTITTRIVTIRVAPTPMVTQWSGPLVESPRWAA